MCCTCKFNMNCALLEQKTVKWVHFTQILLKVHFKYDFNVTFFLASVSATLSI